MHTALLKIPSTKPQHKMEGRFLLDTIVGQGAAIFELFASEDETLLVGGDAFLVGDLLLDIVNGVFSLNIKGYGLTCKCFHKDLHIWIVSTVKVIVLPLNI